MNLKEYKERLAKHDWYYAQSDDSRIYNAGLAEQNALKSMCHFRKTYKKAYQVEFNKYFKNKEHDKTGKNHDSGQNKVLG